MSKVLEEEEYIDSLSNIIARDFYPGLPSNDSTVNLSLDQFQTKYTSQDNHSFNQIIQKNNAERSARIKPFYQQKLLSCGDRIEPLKNNLIFGPQGIDEIKPNTFKKTIHHSNTRLDLNSMPPPSLLLEKSKNQTQFDLVPNTPSIAPGSVFDPSELMTWGSIEGTPIRVDETPGFKIPPTPTRDLIGIQLAEKAKSREKRSTGRSSAAKRILERSHPFLKPKK